MSRLKRFWVAVLIATIISYVVTQIARDQGVIHDISALGLLITYGSHWPVIAFLVLPKRSPLSIRKGNDQPEER